MPLSPTTCKGRERPKGTHVPLLCGISCVHVHLVLRLLKDQYIFMPQPVALQWYLTGYEEQCQNITDEYRVRGRIT